jgi:hypothetical protein
MDHRTDVYSLGVTLYEMLTLKRPFEGKTTQEVLGRILTKEPPNPRKFNPLLPRDLGTIVLKAVEKDPDRRYATAGPFASDLRAFLSFKPITARPASTATRLLKFARRHLPASLAAAAVLLALVTLLAFRFATEYGTSVHRAAYLGLFHSVSSFNNAGSALYTDSIMGFVADPWICLPMCAAIILGGLGFPVLRQLHHELRRPLHWTMNTRVVLAATLLHHPKAIVVDEPMVGLDPKSARLVKDLLRSRAAAGAAVFMSTHTLDVAEQVADRIAIVDHGGWCRAARWPSCVPPCRCRGRWKNCSCALPVNPMRLKCPTP